MGTQRDFLNLFFALKCAVLKLKDVPVKPTDKTSFNMTNDIENGKIKDKRLLDLFITPVVS